MKASEDRHLTTGQLPPSVAARCEGCGLAYELDLLGPSPADLFDVCDDCGSPVYVIGPVAWRDQAEAYLEAFGDGWDACAAFMATVATGAEFVQGAATGRQVDELTEVGSEWAVRLAGGEG